MMSKIPDHFSIMCNRTVFRENRGLPGSSGKATAPYLCAQSNVTLSSLLTGSGPPLSTVDAAAPKGGWDGRQGMGKYL